MDTINLSPQDLAANNQNQLSEKQKSDLRRQRLVWISGTLGIFTILLGLIAVIILKVLDPSFANQGQLFLLAALAIFWSALLRNHPRQWLRANQDLRYGRITKITGQVELALGMGIGLFRTIQYHIHLDDHRFRVSQDIYRQLRPGQTYRIYLTPNAEYFLGAIAIVQESRPDSASGAAVSHILLDPLTDREMEILYLIAAGLTNKEIARQLSLSTNTIKMYASQLYQKLDVSRRTEAVARAREIGLLEE